MGEVPLYMAGVLEVVKGFSMDVSCGYLGFKGTSGCKVMRRER
jgi:hypothetical protein